ncbi:hypothetical protein [Methylobacterium indicum]|uniref:hypothetical protein n=1 Tax=Methylobacterium indicum TaxID=1775910 RepID=UPI0024351EE4|nr:hypothetical protein [Methylobacterium indicum]
MSTRQSFASIDRLVYATPAPEVVARLIESHGLEVAEGRWHWLERRTICGLGRMGRAILGKPSGVKRPRASTPLQEGVAVEAAFVLGSRAAGERAAAMGPSSLLAIEQERGILNLPRADYAERGRIVARSRAAERGEPGAAEAIEATREFERQVGQVLTIALGLVPEQPPTGRYRLPELSPELAAALGECERAAVLKVFPGLAGPPFDPAPILPEETAPMTETAANVSPKRVVPSDDAEIRRAHAATPRAADLAAQWGVGESAVYARLRRLGLTRPRGGVKRAAPASQPQTNVVPFASAYPALDGGLAPDSHASDVSEEPVASLPAVPRPGYPIHRRRLDVEGLAIAVELARRTGLDPLDAISWVRADAASAAYAAGRA